MFSSTGPSFPASKLGLAEKEEPIELAAACSKFDSSTWEPHYGRGKRNEEILPRW